MDVRCERCQTEYEFEDSRITEAGVTVKCTTCGHIFKVKRKALGAAATKADDATASPSPTTTIVAPAPGPLPLQPAPAFGAAPLPAVPAQVGPAGASVAGAERREWKVRQSNGNVFSFRELTTLQKWIVERKVTRDDEISLSGDTWKRLGNIADLASFFQVVDEAQRAAQLTAMQAAPPAPGPGPAASPAQATPALITHFPAAQVPAQVAITLNTAPAPSAATPVIGPPIMVAEGSTAPASKQTVVATSAPATPKRGAAGWLIAVLAVAALGAGGYYGYTEYFLPMQAKTEEAARMAEAARADAERLAREQREAEAARKAEQVRREEEERRAAEEAKQAALAAADAGTTLAVGATDAGTTVAATGGTDAVKAPVRNFDYWMAQGDRLRDQERGEAALDAYGKAVDLKPDRCEPYAGRGLALLDMGSRLQAEAAFKQALKLNPRYGVAIMGLAETYRLDGKTPQAVEYYRKYLEVLPNGPEAPVAKAAIARLGPQDVRD